MKKNVLAIETSGPVMSVAVQKGGATVMESLSDNFMTHAENLLPVIGKLLKKQRLTLDDIHAYLIVRGPGSFTGLRIGFATVKGFLAGSKKPCFGALSLDCIAEGISLPDESCLAVCLDARREKIFTRFYIRKQNAWKPSGKPEILTLPELVRQLKTGTHLTGDALQKYQTQIEELAPGKKLRFFNRPLWYARASYLIPWYHEQSKKLRPLKTANDLVPLYLRLPEPVEKRRLHALTR